MYRMITASTKSSISARNLQQYSRNELVDYLNSLPPDTFITDIIDAPGSWAYEHYHNDVPIIIEKHAGYRTNYGAMSRYGGSRTADWNQADTWWTLSGSTIDVYRLAKILLGKNPDYCVAE